MHQRWRLFGALTVLSLCLLPAFAAASSKRSNPDTNVKPKAKATHSTLRLAMPDTSPAVDPALVADDENVQLAGLLYSGLVRLDSHFHIVPDAASHWKMSPNHRVYTFYLRKGLRFSNGDTVTAEDFRYSITRSLDPKLKSPSAPTYLLDIAGAHSVLEGKAKSVSGLKIVKGALQITVRWPVPYFLMELTYPTSFALDKKVVVKAGIDSWYANPVGSGPYKLKSWAANQKMVLVRNKYYYGSKPAIKTMVLSLSVLPAAAGDLYQYVSHNLDVVSLPSYYLSLVHDTGIYQTKSLAISGIYMNFKTKPFNNAHVRRALTLALKRPALIRSTMGSMATAFGGYVPPGQSGYDRKLHILSYQAATARKELALGGFPGGKNFPAFSLYYGVDPSNTGVANRITKLATNTARAWHKVLKITVDAKQLTVNTLLADSQSNTLPVYLSGWSADYPDAHDFLSAQWRSRALDNAVGYSNPTFDKIVETADVTWNGKQRLKLYDQAQQILVNDAAWIPLYIPHRLVYIRPTVHNLDLTGYGIIPHAGSWAQVKVSSASQTKRRAAE